MRRAGFSCASLLLLATLAEAQPVLSLPNNDNVGGASLSTSVSVTGGTPGHSFAIIGSTVPVGFSFAGTALAVGTDVQIFGVGVLDGSGNGGPIVVPVPFLTRDRFYIQGVTSPTPAFSSLITTPGVVLISALNARIYLAAGGGVNANGTAFALSQGVTVTRNSVGNYSVAYAGQFVGVNVIPSITAFCGASPTGITGVTNGGFTVTFPTDCGFFFTATPIRR
jgi:hypothetical protein